MIDIPIELNQHEKWRANDRTRRWLMFGIVAAAIEGCLQGISTVLELRFWQEDGLTPETPLGFVAILPQAILLTTFLHLSRDVGSRGLWKAAVGFFACSWLGLLLDLGTYETIPNWLTLSISVLGGAGLIGIVIFLFGKWPVFESQETELTPDKDGSSKDDSEGLGCLVQIIALGVYIVFKLLLRNNRRWLWWVPGDAESWAFFEIAVTLVLFFIFAVWFAIAKIKLRDKLGGMSMLLGCTELLVGALHLAILAIALTILTVTVFNNPQVDEAAMDSFFDSKAQLVIVISGVSVSIVSVVTMLFFASVRARSEPDQLTQRPIDRSYQ